MIVTKHWRGGEKRVPAALWQASLAYLVIFGPMRDPFSKEVGVVPEDDTTFSSGLSTHAHAHASPP